MSQCLEVFFKMYRTFWPPPLPSSWPSAVCHQVMSKCALCAAVCQILTSCCCQVFRLLFFSWKAKLAHFKIPFPGWLYTYFTGRTALLHFVNVFSSPCWFSNALRMWQRSFAREYPQQSHTKNALYCIVWITSPHLVLAPFFLQWVQSRGPLPSPTILEPLHHIAFHNLSIKNYFL